MNISQLLLMKQFLECDIKQSKLENIKFANKLKRKLATERNNFEMCDTKQTCEAIEQLQQDSIINECEYHNSIIDGYRLFLPIAPRSETNTCLGCGQQFKITCRQPITMLPYLNHCIRECDQYKMLNKIKKCERCRSLFINKHSYSHHEYVRNQMRTDYLNSQIDCKGCGKQYRASKYRKGLNESVQIRPEFAYYKHCFDECDKFATLGLTKTCTECKRKFINNVGLKNHCRVTGHELSAEVIGKLVRKCICEGCGKQFGTGEKEIVRLNVKYNKHCLEECEKYKKLGLIVECSSCKRKFRNKKSLAIHVQHNSECGEQAIGDNSIKE